MIIVLNTIYLYINSFGFLHLDLAKFERESQEVY